MGPRSEIVEVKNFPRKMSYKASYSRVSLDQPFNLEIH